MPSLPPAPSGTPSRRLRLALCQVNATVGDIGGNAEKVRGGIAEARDAGAALVLFPELAITGYPPEDLLLKEHFLRDARAAVEELATQAVGIVALVGMPERAEDVFNALAVLADGRIQGIYRKMLLPNYGVFDEQRYFQAGEDPAVIDIGNDRVGLTICEDIWEAGPPEADESAAGATLIANISASPYHVGKGAERERMVSQRARDNVACVAYCALVGGQDELVFDGHSFVVDHSGATIARAAQFREETLVCEVDLQAASAERLRDPSRRPAVRRSPPRATLLASVTAPPPPSEPLPERPLAPVLSPEAEVYAALCLGLRDYVEKNGFGHVVLGLSGGIDSALVACLAADSLGPERVTVAIMPSRYSSTGTQQDARDLAGNLGVEALELPIEDAVCAYESTLEPVFDGREPDLTEENIQARIRGNLLMALSNKFGWLVLTTGNKSEMSVGYSTLYGDLAGGLAVIKDVPKTLVYRLCRWRNEAGAGWPASGSPSPIPESIIERAPSAELRADQRDEDSLPPYSALDRILRSYIEHDQDRDQIVAQGLAPEDVDRTLRLVDLAEYKRRQAPPGIKITPRAFGRDRRMPITNRYGG